ncbi:MAG: NAD(P)/FAD-dependent oxidoreductase [Candidatus Omnitrophota bacterium]
MDKHLVLIGAGHIHLYIIKNLKSFTDRNVKVTVIDANEYYYYPAMGAGMLSGMYGPQEIRINVKYLTESNGGEFIEGFVETIDPDKGDIRLVSGMSLSYDVLSFNIGSEIDTGSLDVSFFSMFKVKPIHKLFNARCKIMDHLRKRELKIAVIGGGIAGVEIANHTRQLADDLKADMNISLISDKDVLHGFPPGVRQQVMERMMAHDITLNENITVKENTKKELFLDDGRIIKYDLAFLATGTKAPDLFADSGLPTGEDRGLLVNTYLQSIRYPEIFGGGDCIAFESSPLIKVGLYDNQQRRILFHNLLSALFGERLKAFKPKQDYVKFLDLADGTGILHHKYLKHLKMAGKLVFKLKHKFDKEFMNQYQLCDELDDIVEWHTGKTLGKQFAIKGK